MSSNDGNLDLAVVGGFGLGIFWFFKGFKIYREYRVLADTPEMPIRSIAMGLVEIHGKAKGEKLVNSPVTNTPCHFYKVDIEKYEKDSKGRGSWRHYKTDADGVPFYLDDGTGRVLVDPRGAEYDLVQTARRETASGTIGLTTLFGGARKPNPAARQTVSDQELVAYAESLRSTGGSSALASLGQVALGGLSFGSGVSGCFRFTEYCILQDHWYDITGTCAENPKPQDEHDRNLIKKGENEPTFLISWRSEKEIERTLRNRAALHIFGGAALSVVCLGFLLNKFGWL